jgi:sec-independent protein translocase protein TatC
MDDLQSAVEQYGGYIEDIRRRLYRVVVVFCMVFIAGFFSTAPLVKVLVRFFHIKDALLVATSPFQLLDLAMSIGFFWAIVITLPFFVQQLYSFLHTGLLERERRLFLVLLPIGIVLFTTGFAYGFAVMYYALGIVAEVNVGLGVTNLWDISQFISQIMTTALLLGVLFEFPLVLTFLMRMGVMSPTFLVDKRRYAVVVILIFVALLPPTDGLSDIIMVAPLLLIYELTIWVNSRGRNRHLHA